MKHFLKACFHFFIRKKFTPICLLDALLHCGAKESIFIKQAQSSFCDQLFRILARMHGKLQEARFLLRIEVKFHIC